MSIFFHSENGTIHIRSTNVMNSQTRLTFASNSRCSNRLDVFSIVLDMENSPVTRMLTQILSSFEFRFCCCCCCCYWCWWWRMGLCVLCIANFSNRIKRKQTSVQMVPFIHSTKQKSFSPHSRAHVNIGSIGSTKQRH